jgi:hypothetical protein
MIEKERLIDRLYKFSMEDMFDADKRKSHERFIESLCKCWVSIGKSKLNKQWVERLERFGQFIDSGIERYDYYQEVIMEELRDESN